MVSLTVVFWMYVILFAIIGGMRGWARELLVAFSVILALTFTTLLENYVPFIRDVLKPDSPVLYFWLRFIIIVLLVFFGYQTPNIPRFAAKMSREKIQDVLLGIFIGALNGYLIVGTIWFYMYEANYPFAVIAPPEIGSQVEKIANAMLQYMPPKILGIPGIYFAVVVAFIFVLVVFL
jgi:uncharacterized membrane protein required for colicin V production